MPASRQRAGAPRHPVSKARHAPISGISDDAPPRPAYGARRKMPGLLRRRAARSQAARRLRARISLDGAAAVRVIPEAWRALPPRRFLHKCRIVISSCTESSNSSADCHAAARKPGAAMHAALWPIRCLRPASMNSRARRPSGCQSHAIGSRFGAFLLRVARGTPCGRLPDPPFACRCCRHAGRPAGEGGGRRRAPPNAHDGLATRRPAAFMFCHSGRRPGAMVGGGGRRDGSRSPLAGGSGGGAALD